jgi:hypothetical protein
MYMICLNRIARIRRSQTAATTMSALQRFEELFEREQRRHSPEWLLMEEEKMTRLRLALFGCAPK